MLSGTVKPKTTEPKRLIFRNVVRKILLEDWPLKLIALLITLGLWLGVTGLSTPATKRLSVQLAPPNLATNFQVTNNLATEVDIVVSGDDRILKTLTGKDLVASLDLTTVQPGDRVVSLSPENVSVNLPPGVRLDGIQPSRIAVKIEAVVERELPVRLDIQGTPADGFEIYTQTISPPKVQVTGPAGYLKTLEAISTDPVSVDGKKDELIVKQIPIGVSNAKSIIFNNGAVVDVTIRIGEKRREQVYVLPASQQTGEKKVAVTLYGPKTLLSRIKATDLRIEMVKNEMGGEIPQAVLKPEFVDVVEVKKVKLY